MGTEGIELMNSQQAADRLGITQGRVRQLARAGTLKGQRIGRDWLFRPEDIDAYDRANPQVLTYRRRKADTP